MIIEMTLEEMEKLEPKESSSYETREVASLEELEFLKNDWAITWVGLSAERDSIESMLKFVEGFTPLFKREVWITKGSIMNKAYGLTGDNAYPDDLNIVSIPLSHVMFPDNLSAPRILCGGRWMWDIVENNLLRQKSLNEAAKKLNK